MPEMDGFGLIERMRDDLPCARFRCCPHLHWCPEDAQRCRALGVHAHLNKPFGIRSSWTPCSKARLAATNAPAPVAPIPGNELCVFCSQDNAVNQRLAMVILESWGIA
jgi:hypothetical protein